MLVAIAFWVSWPNLGCYYLADDFAYVARYMDFPWAKWPSLFVNEWSGGMWQMNLPELRPMVALLYMIDGVLWGANPLGSHLTNMMLHLGGGLWVHRLARLALPQASEKGWVPLLAAALFLLSPSHAEPVAWVAGRTDLMGTFFYLGTVALGMAWLRERRSSALVLAWVSFGCGVFSKEFVLTAPIMLLGWVLTRPKEERGGLWRSGGVLLAGLAAVFVVYLVCRRIAFEGAGGVAVTMTAMQFVERHAQYLSWLVPPFFGPVGGVADWPVWVLIGAGLVIVQKGITGRGVLFFGVIWYLVATLPLMVTYYSPRHLCLASAGAAIAVVAWLVEVRLKGLVVAGIVGVVAVYSAVRTRDEAIEWMRNAKISERISMAVISADAERAAGTVIVLDVPANHRGRFLWSWATPFAIKPPFVPREVVDVFEGPHVYVAPHNWAKQKDWERLGRAERVWLLIMDKKHLIQRSEVSRERVVAELEKLRVQLEKVEPGEAWEQFVSAIK